MSSGDGRAEGIVIGDWRIKGTLRQLSKDWVSEREARDAPDDESSDSTWATFSSPALRGCWVRTSFEI